MTAKVILQTKLQMPQLGTRLISRPRLIDRLATGLNGRLTLVAAPAGYGKTTLVTDCLHGPKTRAAWLSLDESDNDPRRFLDYLLAALRRVQEDLGRSVEAMLRSPQPPPGETILSALLNDMLAMSQSFVLVLDDYHVIHARPIHQQLSFLLEHQPPHLHMVIISREDPPLSLSRLRARGQLTEIRQSDLRFSPEECGEFLRQLMGLHLSADDVVALEQRTEGWIAGLQLAALSLRGHEDAAGFIRAFTGSSRFILDYLVEEVFDRQPPDVKDFLLKTSILERLCGALCDEVIGNQSLTPAGETSKSQLLLELLEHSNLFIVPLDQSRQWYRYHRLFAELLRHRLVMVYPGLDAELHQRASQWLEANGLMTEAIQHALAARDWERSARLIGMTADELLKRGQLVTLIGWYQQIPEELIRSQPHFGMSYAWALLLSAKFDEAEELLAYFERIGKDAPILLGQVATAQAYAARTRGDNRRVIEKSERALELLPESDLVSRCALSLNLGLVHWHAGQLREAVPRFRDVQAFASRTENQYAELTAQIFLARTLVSQGVLRQAEHMLRKTIQAGGDNPILVLANYDLSGIYYEWNDLAKAWKHMEQGLEISTRSGNVEFQNGGHMLKACLLMAQGNMPGALAEAERTHALSQNYGTGTQARSMACHAQVALSMGDVAAAEQWVEKITEDVDINSFYRFIGLARARLLLAQGKKPAAREFLDERLARATKAGWGYAILAIRTLQARAAENEDTALAILSEGLKASAPEGFIRTYVDAGTGLIPVLQDAARQGILPEYVGRILSAFDIEAKSTLSLVEPLSRREIQVLRLMAAGLSNREIADRLIISTGTAKTHVHNVCGKLGVRNRTEAAMRAKELNLI